MNKKTKISAKKKPAKAPVIAPADLLAVAYIGPLVEAFLISQAPQKWTPTRLGREALKDPARIFELRRGIIPKQSTALKILGVINRAAPGFVSSFMREKLGGVKA